MPNNYISLVRPPKSILEAYTELAESRGMVMEHLMGFVLQHAVTNKSLYDADGVSPLGKHEKSDGNVNIPASVQIKKDIKEWAKSPPRSQPNVKTLWILRRFLHLKIDVSRLPQG